jgi:endonuclease G
MQDAQGNILKTDGQPYREGIDDLSTIAWVANEGVRKSRIFETLELRSNNEPMVAEALRRLRSHRLVRSDLRSLPPQNPLMKE